MTVAYLQPKKENMGAITLLFFAAGAAVPGRRGHAQFFHAAECIGPDAPFVWRQGPFVWEAPASGRFTILCRATDSPGRQQPERVDGNVLGYGNNGVREHVLTVDVIPP